MVQAAYDFVKLATEIASLLKAEGIVAQEILLYGSQARGGAGPDSDIDVVIISKDLQKYQSLNRLEVLSRIAWKCDAPLEIIGYTPDEVKDKAGKSILWDEILATSKVIYRAA
jgi:predicted nucleotidyltransferase